MPPWEMTQHPNNNTPKHPPWRVTAVAAAVVVLEAVVETAVETATAVGAAMTAESAP